MDRLQILVNKDLKLRFQKRMLDEGKSMGEVIRQFMSDYLQEKIKEAA